VFSMERKYPLHATSLDAVEGFRLVYNERCSIFNTRRPKIAIVLLGYIIGKIGRRKLKSSGRNSGSTSAYRMEIVIITMGRGKNSTWRAGSGRDGAWSTRCDAYHGVGVPSTSTRAGASGLREMAGQ
jgi:hypothetical protein